MWLIKLLVALIQINSPNYKLREDATNNLDQTYFIFVNELLSHSIEPEVAYRAKSLYNKSLYEINKFVVGWLWSYNKELYFDLYFDCLTIPEKDFIIYCQKDRNFSQLIRNRLIEVGFLDNGTVPGFLTGGYIPGGDHESLHYYQNIWSYDKNRFPFKYKRNFLINYKK